MEYNVLIAEDDESIVELLTLYLNSNGFNVISANDGEAAMELLRHRKTDIVLVDIMMSKMNGYELIKAIRQENNLPIIIISAKNEDSDKILGLNLGADAYITKPFNPLEVIAYVRAMLRRYYENDDRTMMVHISNIRAKIEDDPANPKYIKTVRGLGYKMDSDD